MLAHVPSFGRNPRGSTDFLAYPVPKACMHVLGALIWYYFHSYGAQFLCWRLSLGEDGKSPTY